MPFMRVTNKVSLTLFILRLLSGQRKMD